MHLKTDKFDSIPYSISSFIFQFFFFPNGSPRFSQV